MAILKHGTSKNPNYGDALTYLLFEHDGFTMQPVLGESRDFLDYKKRTTVKSLSDINVFNSVR